MPARTPTQLQRLFEIKYPRGYRYLDRCGDVMVILEDLLSAATGKPWMPDEMRPTGARMKCPDKDMVLVFDTERLAMESAEAGDDDGLFVRLSELASRTAIAKFDLKQLTRCGYRHITILPTDSIEEAEALVVRISPVKDWPIPPPATLRTSDCDVVVRYEDKDHRRGFRVVVASQYRFDAIAQVDERLKTPPHLLPTGQRQALLDQLRRNQQRAAQPQAGILMDVDCYHNLPPIDISFPSFIAEAKLQYDTVAGGILRRIHA